MGVLIRTSIVIAIILGSVAAAAVRLRAQEVSTPGLTAAFIFNFVKFTTWPNDVLRDGGPIVVCVIANDQVADALVQITQKKTVDGHALAIRRTALDRPLTECHLVFGASLDANSARELVRATAGQPILTVSNLEDFAVRGGVANFFIDGGKMRFAVNSGAADRARLRISSRLLSLARVVPDTPGLR